MKKLLYGICCLLILVVVAASGLRRAKAVNVTAPGVRNTPFALTNETSERQMALQSDLIVTGQCLDLQSAWIQDGRVLVTLATVSVGETIKGEPASTVTVVLPGGTDANRSIPLAMTYPGAPSISPQEEVFLFLTREDAVAGGYAVSGFSDGKYSIVEDEAGNKLVARDYVKGRVRNSPGVVRGNRQFAPLSSFKNKIREYLGQ